MPEVNSMSDSQPEPAPPPRPYTSAELIRRMLALGWRYRAGSLLVLVQQVALVALALVALGLTGLGIDVIRAAVDPAADAVRWPLGFAPPSHWTALTTVAAIAAGIVGLAVFHAGLRFCAAVTLSRLVQRIVVQLRSDVYDKLQRLSFRFFDSNQSGSIINRVAGDVQAVRVFVDGVMIQVLTVLLSLSVYLAYMLSVHVPLTVACLATTPVLWMTAILFSRLVRPAYAENSKLHDNLVLTLSENIQGSSVVKGFAREDEEIAKFGAVNAQVRDHKRQIFWRISLFQPFMGFMTQLNMIVLLGYGGYLVINGKILLGEGLFVFARLLHEFSSQVGQVTNIANSIQTSLTGAERVFEILDAPLEVADRPDAKPLSNARGHVRFENVAFAYNPGAPVLANINFEVRPGQCVAIVGATGAGKSSLLSLIPRFYDPSSGRVFIDGIDVRDLRIRDLRRNVGLVFQETFLFSNTVAANIAFGQPYATREQIERAARIASAHSFISELPDGYDTVIGEYGCDLSGGQRQRLAIARAVLLEPPILILDDALAAIDPSTEQEILDAMESAMRGRTTFVVAHRQSTLRQADFIVVLDQGQIVQVGTHDELMQQKGHYLKAARLQHFDDRAVLSMPLPIPREGAA